MPMAGYLVARDEMTMTGVIVAGTAASVLGALLLYWLGAVLGEARLKSFADRHGHWLTLSGMTSGGQAKGSTAMATGRCGRAG